MNYDLKPRNRFSHLYNPKEEGLGAYDFHYINAYKKKKRIKIDANKKLNERYAA
tara:strand:+ start:1825 stop:1986 length:162 start_codon:yes stop_codon:yes gene_type:complete